MALPVKTPPDFFCNIVKLSLEKKSAQNSSSK